jgi:hypothetical protein
MSVKHTQYTLVALFTTMRTSQLSITTYYQHIPVTGQGFGGVLYSLTGSTSGKSKRRVIALLYLVFVLP